MSSIVWARPGWRCPRFGYLVGSGAQDLLTAEPKILHDGIDDTFVLLEGWLSPYQSESIDDTIVLSRGRDSPGHSIASKWTECRSVQ